MDILDKIIDGTRMPVLFIGAGISKRYLTNSPSWVELLDILRNKIGINEQSYHAMVQIIENYYPNIPKGKIYPKIVSKLEDELLNKIKNDDIDLSTILSKEELKDCYDNGSNYLKKLVAQEFHHYDINESYLDEINMFKSISGKVAMVYTTNYDSFLEDNIFNDFTVYDNQDKYYFRNNDGYGELYKIHGDIKNSNSIVIRENDYNEFDKNLKIVTAKLLNTFLDYPVIFMGYSLEDENIKKIMADFINSFSDEIINKVRENLIFVEYRKGENELKIGEKQFSDEKSRSITMTTIITDNFSKIYEHISHIKPTVTSVELKKYKSTIVNLLNKAVAGEEKVVVKDLEETDDNNIAIYIGNKDNIDQIPSIGYSAISNKDLMEAILLDKKTMSWDNIVTSWYSARKFSAHYYTPVFIAKFNTTKSLDECSPVFIENYNNRKKYFMNKKFEESRGAEIDDIKKEYLQGKDDKTSFNNKAMKVCKDINVSLYRQTINADKALEFMRYLLNDNHDFIDTTHFRKTLCYVWYIKYELEANNAS